MGLVTTKKKKVKLSFFSQLHFFFNFLSLGYFVYDIGFLNW